MPDRLLFLRYETIQRINTYSIIPDDYNKTQERDFPTKALTTLSLVLVALPWHNNSPLSAASKILFSGVYAKGMILIVLVFILFVAGATLSNGECQLHPHVGRSVCTSRPSFSVCLILPPQRTH